MLIVPTGLLTLTQVIDHLVDAQAPDLRVKIWSESLELHALPRPVSRVPAPISPRLGAGSSTRMASNGVTSSSDQ